MSDSPADRGAGGRGLADSGAAAASRGRDLLGLALVVLAVFGGAWVVMALQDPRPDQDGATGAAMTLVRGLGPVALLFAAAGLAAIGMGLWFRGIRGSVGRHLLGVLITTFTLSILSGALSAALGGSFGSALGGAVTNRLTLFVSLPFGVACVGVGAWAVWRRRGGPAPSVEPRTLAPERSRSSESDGVTSAEAEALLPRVPAPPPRPGVVETLSPTPASPAPAPAAATSWTAPAFPYPPDVRRQGGIPEGARPLGTPQNTHVRSQQGARDAAPLQHDAARAPEGPAAGRAGRAVAGDAAAERPVGAPLHGPESRPSPVPTGPGPRSEPQDAVAPAPASPADPGDLEEPTFEIHVQAPAGADEPLSPVPAPSWEQPALFDGEPVDAYGTPMSLVDALRKSEAELRAEVGEVEAAQWTEGAAEVAPLPPAASPPSGALEEHQGEDEVEVEGVGTAVPLVVAPHNGTQLDETDLDADLDQGGPESELEAAFPNGFHGEVESEEDRAGAHGLLEESSEPAPWTVADTAPQAVADSAPQAIADTAPQAVDAAPSIEAPASTPASTPVEPPRKAAIVAPLLFEEPPAAAAAAETQEPAAEPRKPRAPRAVKGETAAKNDAKRAAASGDDEKAAEPSGLADVVLQPQSPPPPLIEGVDVQLAVDPKVFKAGCLFVERQRVAVSMLQREFGFDFQEATDVLDQLQKAGLIGPYLGGQRRDILLTLEQWKEKVGAD